MKHPCYAANCEIQIAPPHIMCPHHWSMIPITTKNRVELARLRYGWLSVEHINAIKTAIDTARKYQIRAALETIPSTNP